MATGRLVSGGFGRVHCQQHPNYPLNFIQAGLFTFFASRWGGAIFSGVNTSNVSLHNHRCNEFELLNPNTGNLIWVNGFSTDISVSFKSIGRILSAFLRGQGKRTFNLLNWKTVTLPLYTKTTQILRKPPMASELKPQTRESINDIRKIPTHKQNSKTDWSRQIYVHIHIKKRAVSGIGDAVGEWGERIWAIR